MVSIRLSPRWHLLIFYIYIDQLSIILTLFFHRDNVTREEFPGQGQAGRMRIVLAPCCLLFRAKGPRAGHTHPASPSPALSALRRTMPAAWFLLHSECRPAMEIGHLCGQGHTPVWSRAPGQSTGTQAESWAVFTPPKYNITYFSSQWRISQAFQKYYSDLGNYWKNLE